MSVFVPAGVLPPGCL